MPRLDRRTIPPFPRKSDTVSRMLEVRLRCSTVRIENRVPVHEEGFLSTFRKGSALVVLIAGVALVAAVSAFGGASKADATTVAVTLGKPGEFNITLSKKTVVKGVTTFKVTNKGAIAHDFKIAGKKTPSLKTGKAATVKATLKKGKYPFVCTLPGHAAGGMKGTLTVK
jgi:uncharacterized cupredoxin-like copper-binding protein